MRSRPRLAFAAMVATTAFAAGRFSGRTPDEIRRDYATTWARLVALDVQSGSDLDAVEASDDVGRAWDLMAEMASATLRANPAANSQDVRNALRSLDVEDRVATCRRPDADVEDFPIFCELARFGVEADALALSPPPHAVFAIAVSYSYFGRLLVVSDEEVLASRRIHRRGEIRVLPDGAGGAKRFHVRGDAEDWPTSNCGGGELSVWEWRDGGLRSAAQHGYGHPRGEPRFNRIFRHGRWLKLYDREFRTVMSSCADGTIGRRIWKLRLDPDRIRDFGLRPVDRNFGVVEQVVHRGAHGRDPKGLATPAAMAEARELLAGLRRRPLWDVYRVETEGRRTRLSLTGWKDPTLVFTIDWSRGRPIVTGVRGEGPEPPLTGGNTATSSPSDSR